MSALILILVLQNIWSVTPLASTVPRESNCIYKHSKNGHAPLAFYDKNELLNKYFSVPDKTKIRLICPGNGNYLKQGEKESPRKVQELNFLCNEGIWTNFTYFEQCPNSWSCEDMPSGTFEKRGECNEKMTDKFNFYVEISKVRGLEALELFYVCRTKINPRTVDAVYKVTGNDLPPKDAALPGRTFPINAYSGYTGHPSRFKRYQQVEMVRKYGMKETFKYFGSPELDLSLTPTTLVPFEDYPQLDGLQAEQNSFLLYSSVLQHLQIIDEAIRELSIQSKKKVRVVKITSEDNDEFKNVNLFTPQGLLIFVRQENVCVGILITNRLDLIKEDHKNKCKLSCSGQGWPDLLERTKGLVECCSSEELNDFEIGQYECIKGKVLQGPFLAKTSTKKINK